MCRGPGTVFNAPAAGRAVATIGELALAVQVKSYLEDTALRLGVRSKSMSSLSIAAAVVAEGCSWLGVLTGISRFFCVEYCFWVAIAAMWGWDAAELLHKSTARGDAIVHAMILSASLALIVFNLVHELPHFFVAKPMNADLASNTLAMATPFACTQDANSPIWLTRLPFFVTYFAGASASSTILAARYNLGNARSVKAA